MYLGDWINNSVHTFPWDSNAAAGGSLDPVGGTIVVYKDAGDTPIASGITDDRAPNATGAHRCTIDTSGDDYTAASDYRVVLEGAVIDGETVNATLAAFSIENRYPCPNRIAATLLDLAGAVDGKTLRQTMQILAAVLAGKVSGAGTGTEKFRSLDDAADRVTVAVDPYGNRTGVEMNVE